MMHQLKSGQAKNLCRLMHLIAMVLAQRLAQPDTLSQAALMNQGLDLLYRKGDPAGAGDKFCQVLQRNPTHYGATFQLARALDQAGKSNEARPYWQKMVTMADAIKDRSTADTARARLEKTR
jgi:cytochrome c-type biogenesis protein CcmH/NrfG